MKAFTSTRSPSDSRPSSTPTVARQTINVTAVAMMALWPVLSSESEVWLRTAACSQRAKLSS